MVFHQWGVVRMRLRELKAWLKSDDFVYKTNVYRPVHCSESNWVNFNQKGTKSCIKNLSEHY
jgi:hypothetical protein